MQKQAFSKWRHSPRKATVWMLILFLLPQVVAAQAPIQITFSTDELGKFPSQWTTLNGNHNGEIYTVQSEEGKRFLHADAKGVGVQIGYEKKWALKDYPVLQWQWRAVLFPEGTNEHDKNANDSVLGVYVIFGMWPFSIKVIKYIWSDTLAVGYSFVSPAYKNARIVVLESGRTLKGQWITEKRNVLDDYRRLFGDGDSKATPVARGIGLLTDSDNTHTHAIGDYADIQVMRLASELPAWNGSPGCPTTQSLGHPPHTMPVE
jgi:hypothetical protein